MVYNIVPVEETSGNYLIDTDGDVWSRFGHGVAGVLKVYHKLKPAIRTSKGHKSGYKVVSLKFDDGTRRNVYVHRLMAQTFLPNPENKREVNHIDGNKLNNNIDNLEWCTSSENRLHAYREGLNDGSVTSRKHIIHYIKESPYYRKKGDKFVTSRNLVIPHQKTFSNEADCVAYVNYWKLKKLNELGV